MKLTEEEKQIILEKRKKEEEKKAKKIGYLKENLYYCENSVDLDFYDLFITEAIKEEIIQKITKQFELAVPKGTEFVCFIDESKEELWYDNINYGIVDMSANWAKKHLINIKKMK